MLLTKICKQIHKKVFRKGWTCFIELFFIHVCTFVSCSFKKGFVHNNVSENLKKRVEARKEMCNVVADSTRNTL